MIAGFFAFITFFAAPFMSVFSRRNLKPEQAAYGVCKTYKQGADRLDPTPEKGRKTARFQADTTGTLNALHRGTVRVRSL
jgi:hypothetical protein